jgi:hypothetical protein
MRVHITPCVAVVSQRFSLARLIGASLVGLLLCIPKLK